MLLSQEKRVGGKRKWYPGTTEEETGDQAPRGTASSGRPSGERSSAMLIFHSAPFEEIWGLCLLDFCSGEGVWGGYDKMPL